MERIRPTVLVGDIHGCLEEFDELLKLIEYDQFNKDQMRLILLGDLFDRGPDPLGCIRRARELNLECILGNHEEKQIRWNKNQNRFIQTGEPNLMKRMSEVDCKVNESLNEDDWKWIKGLPLKLDLGLNWWAVHAGMEPCYSLHNQRPSQIMRVRYVDQNGKAKPLNLDKSQPEGTVYWDELWKGPESIIYGHCVHDLREPRIKISGDVNCIGIDTGCCFGGRLTAFILKNVDNKFETSFVQVQAKKKYYAGYGDE